jgi:tRNA pseudouridine65 synthase
VAAKLSEQFINKLITKKYIALVRGHTLPKGCIDYALKEQQDKMTDALAQKDKEAQDAITHYETLWQGEVPIAVGRYTNSRYSLVSLTPETGRKHQLRRHMKHIFHPIVGDTTHGDGKHNTMFRDNFNLQRLLLVAKELSFEHPITEKKINLSASMGEEFKCILQRLGCMLKP